MKELTRLVNGDLFLSSQHPVSRRFAVLEDDGKSAWLYLTEPGIEKPVADAWVYNRIPPPSPEEVPSYRSGPPPAAIGYASHTALYEDPHLAQWSFLWSSDGESVAILKDQTPVAFVAGAKNPGYSRELLKDGPWGRVWSEPVYRATFQVPN